MDNMNNNRTDEVNSVNQPQEEQKSVFPTAVKGIALIIGLFILGNIIGSLTNIQWSDNISAQNQLSEVSTSYNHNYTYNRSYYQRNYHKKRVFN